MTDQATATRQSSNQFARQRDDRVCWLLDTHPVTAAMLVSLGFFPSKGKALKRLNRLVLKKRLKLIGVVCRKSGRPEYVYCRWRPQALLHEIELTEVCFRLHAGRILRGPHVEDKDVLPDAEVWINGECYFVELDRGTMGYAQVAQQRFPKYERCRRLTLWICSSPARMEGLKQRAERIQGTALFTTLDEALASPHGAIWRDYRGETAALPREGEYMPGEKRGKYTG